MSDSPSRRDIGAFIRDLRRTAGVSVRQLAARAGVSNPYLSQVERGLRRPSAQVLAQIANALRVSTPLMYLRAGLLDAKEGQGVLAAIAADSDLTVNQKQALIQIYETFRRENARSAASATHPPAERHGSAGVTATEPAGTPVAESVGTTPAETAGMTPTESADVTATESAGVTPPGRPA